MRMVRRFAASMRNAHVRRLARRTPTGYFLAGLFVVIAGRMLFSAHDQPPILPLNAAPQESAAPRLADERISNAAHPPSSREEVGRLVERHARRLGSFRPSFFQIVDETDSLFRGRPRTVAVRDEHGRTLARVSREFYRRMCTEGAGRLRDGRVLTYATRIGSEIRFRFSDAPYGLSHRETPLVPFRSVAVDEEIIALGSVLYVPALEGLILPDGSRHDGIFFADDVGSALRGRCIDFFVGFEDHIHNTFSSSRKVRHSHPVEVYLIPRELTHGLVERHRVAQALRGVRDAGDK